MSILVYKQRHRHPNKKSTPGANYAHIRYIATRPRVLKREGAKHGLFGKLEPGSVKEFATWEEIARLAYTNSRKGIIMYRSVVSFAEDTARELLLKDQKSWQRYMENHVMTIAEKNRIKRENLQWVAAVHGEKKHPHLHLVFWDKSKNVRNPFTPPQVPAEIRKQMIKDTFREKILTYAKEKDLAVKGMRQVTNELVEQFEQEILLKNPGRYKAAKKKLEEELGQELTFDKHFLTKLAEELFFLRRLIPENGRISYQLLPPESKEKTDELVELLLSEVVQLKTCAKQYAEAKCSMARLYSDDKNRLLKQRKQYEEEAKKILANRILSGIKAICRLEQEKRGEAYRKSHKEYLAFQIILEALDMLAKAVEIQEQDLEEQLSKEELSKEAKKELVLKYQDKGYEH